MRRACRGATAPTSGVTLNPHPDFRGPSTLISRDPKRAHGRARRAACGGIRSLEQALDELVEGLSERDRARGGTGDREYQPAPSARQCVENTDSDACGYR